MTTTPAEVMHAARARLGISQTAFADLLNQRAPGLAATQRQVSLWELGKRQPHPALVALVRSLTND